MKIHIFHNWNPWEDLETKRSKGIMRVYEPVYPSSTNIDPVYGYPPPLWSELKYKEVELVTRTQKRSCKECNRQEIRNL